MHSWRWQMLHLGVVYYPWWWRHITRTHTHIKSNIWQPWQKCLIRITKAWKFYNKTFATMCLIRNRHRGTSLHGLTHNIRTLSPNLFSYIHWLHLGINMYMFRYHYQRHRSRMQIPKSVVLPSAKSKMIKLSNWKKIVVAISSLDLNSSKKGKTEIKPTSLLSRAISTLVIFNSMIISLFSPLSCFVCIYVCACICVSGFISLLFVLLSFSDVFVRIEIEYFGYSSCYRFTICFLYFYIISSNTWKVYKYG